MTFEEQTRVEQSSPDSLVRKNPPLWNPCLETTGSTEYGFAGQKKSSSLESLFGDDRIDRIWIRWSEKILLSGILVWRRPDRPNMDSMVRKMTPQESAGGQENDPRIRHPRRAFFVVNSGK